MNGHIAQRCKYVSPISEGALSGRLPRLLVKFTPALDNAVVSVVCRLCYIVNISGLIFSFICTFKFMLLMHVSH